MNDRMELIRGSDETLLVEMFEDEEEAIAYDLSTVAAISVVDGSDEFPSVAPTAVITDAVNGQIALSFTDVQTTAMRADYTYSFRLDLDFGGGVNTKTPDFKVVAR